MRNSVNSMLTSGGKISSKRVVTVIAFLMMSIGFIANLFWDYKVDEFIYVSMQWIVMVGLGTTASEQFSRYMVKDNGESMEKSKRSSDIPPDADNV